MIYMYMYIYNQLREACITCIMDFFYYRLGQLLQIRVFVHDIL